MSIRALTETDQITDKIKSWKLKEEETKQKRRNYREKVTELINNADY